MSSVGLSHEEAMAGKFGGVLQWDFTVEAQETGVRLGVCYEDECEADFASADNRRSLCLVGCGSGQRYVRGEWVTEGIVAEEDAITSGKSATFTLDMRSATLWVSVQGRGKKLVADNLSSGNASLRVHPAAFLRTGDRVVTFGPLCENSGYPQHETLPLPLTLVPASESVPRDCTGRTVLIRACEKAAPLWLLAALLSSHPEAAKAATVNLRLPLHVLCTAHGASVAAVEVVYAANREAVSAADAHGHFPLSLAIIHCAALEVVACLLRLDPSAACAGDVAGRLPLHLALQHRSPPAVVHAVLLAYPAAASVADLDGQLPCHTCCFSAPDEAVLRMVLQSYPEAACKKNHFGQLPLHRALDGRVSAACLSLLLEAFPGAVKEKDMKGRSPLSAACEHSRGGDCREIASLLQAWPEAARERNSLGQLPLHVACIADAPLQAVQQILAAYPAAGADCAGEARKLPLILAIEHHASDSVVAELLPLSIRHIVGDPHGRTSEEQQQQCGWTTLLRDGRDAYAASVAAVLDLHSESIEQLAMAPDEHGRRAVDIATPLCKGEILKRLYLCGRFEIKDGPPLHQSATSRVHYAIDHLSASLSIAHPTTGTASDGGGEKVQVVLKFMKSREQWGRELTQREDSCQHASDHSATQAQFIVPVLASFDSTSDAEFSAQLARRGLLSHPFLLVMAAGDRCLAQIIDHEREVPDWDQEVVRCARQVAASLHYFHSRGSIHGDLKPRNIVRIGTRYYLIDLDASATFGESAGSKRSTAFSPPELLEATQREAVLPAAPSFDAWGLGVTLFHLLTGQSLLHADSSDNAADEGQLALALGWSAEAQADKLSRVADRCARNLLSLLLHRSPDSRPGMSHVLQHPFITGKNALRLAGEAALYDCFLSYRVASDRPLAERLYTLLTAASWAVFWDVKCLKPGESWEEGFCRGLAQSHIFVPILSRGAINHASQAKQSFAHLHPDSPCDNVLLEYMLAVEMHQRSLLRFIYPIFVGDLEEGHGEGECLGEDARGVFTNYFAAGCHPKVSPSTRVQSVESKFREHLDRLSLGCPMLPERDLAVASVLESITINQGSFVEGPAEEALAMQNVLRDVGAMLAANETRLERVE